MYINGTILWYYNICKREVWLMAHGIVADQEDENMKLGKFIHENSYKRKKKEISFGNVKFDVVYESKNKLIIGETKKSSKFEEASKWQLLYYLRVLKECNIDAEGVLLVPEEKKKTKVILDIDNEKKLENIICDIEKICNENIPPKVEKIGYCKNCAYREYCYS
ncbi:CRISPR-associated protein Cas4 [Clostridium sp. DL1XJH146]